MLIPLLFRYFLAHPALILCVCLFVVLRIKPVEGMSHFPDWERQGDGLVFRGTHYLVISKKQDGMKAVRSLMDEARAGLIYPCCNLHQAFENIPGNHRRNHPPTHIRDGTPSAVQYLVM